jgi:hypothetical protein
MLHLLEGQAGEIGEYSNETTLDTETKPVSVWNYSIHTIYLLRVSTTNVAIFKEGHYKGWLHRSIAEVLDQRADVKYSIM